MLVQPECLSELGDTQIWQIRLDVYSAYDAAVFERILSVDELAKAERFASEIDRNRSKAARGHLRQILGSYVGIAPGELRFGYGRHGKPYLLRPDKAAMPQFNVSHSDDRLLIAVSPGTPVGVDIERVRSDADWRAIARRFYSRGENAHLAALDEADALTEFHRVWTIKEAYVKALGRGLAFPLSDVEVTLQNGTEHAKISEIAADKETARAWVVSAIPTGAGYVASLVRERFSLIK